MLKVTLTGKAIDRAVSEFNSEFAREVRSTIKSTTQDIHRGMLRRVPVDSGDLKESIGIHLEPWEGTTGVFFEDARYGRFPEFGTGQQAGQQFVFKAYQMARRRFFTRLRQAADKSAKG